MPRKLYGEKDESLGFDSVQKRFDQGAWDQF